MHLVVRTDRNTPIGLFEGYYNDPAMTSETWRDGIYYTGDMAKRDSDGYLWFIGRADDVIKSSGYRIGPFEVEHALQEHPAVQECAVTGVPDPQRGFIVKATVVLNDGYAACDKLRRELQAHVKRITAAYKVPRLIEFVASLPKTISGKIRRFEVRLKDSIPPLPKLPSITDMLGAGKSRDKSVPPGEDPEAPQDGNCPGENPRKISKN